MICAYCGRETKGTKEHIISCGILDLFPECYMTIDNGRNKIYPADPMVKDVYAECNNKKNNAEYNVDLLAGTYYFEVEQSVGTGNYNFMCSLPMNYTLGDVDNDGKISAADARLVLRASVGLKGDKDVHGFSINFDDKTSRAFKAANVDFDDKISAAMQGSYSVRLSVWKIQKTGKRRKNQHTVLHSI